jgi:hypothetical protein
VTPTALIECMLFNYLDRLEPEPEPPARPKAPATVVPISTARRRTRRSRLA